MAQIFYCFKDFLILGQKIDKTKFEHRITDAYINLTLSPQKYKSDYYIM